VKWLPRTSKGSARWINYWKIKTWMIPSRAVAGLAEGPYIFAVPGSTGAYKDAKHEISVRQQDDRRVSASFRKDAAADGVSEMSRCIHGFL
jgi:molybdopterin biosynthesis enzyme MoaB